MERDMDWSPLEFEVRSNTDRMPRHYGRGLNDAWVVKNCPCVREALEGLTVRVFGTEFSALVAVERMGVTMPKEVRNRLCFSSENTGNKNNESALTLSFDGNVVCRETKSFGGYAEWEV